jgi:hypothetical protein
VNLIPKLFFGSCLCVVPMTRAQAQDGPSPRWAAPPPVRYDVLLRIGRPHVRFILVNGRTPHHRSLCVMCDRSVGAHYLREFATHLIYCDQNCYEAHCSGAVLLLDNQAMAS